MAFENLKDQLKESATAVWSKVEESSIYIELNEKFQDLSPVVQRLLIVAGLFFVALILLFMPYIYLSDSSDALADFEDKKALIRDMYKGVRIAKQVRESPQPISGVDLRNRAQGVVDGARLVKDQVRAIEPYDNKNYPNPSGILPKDVIQEGVMVSLSKLNLRQIVDLGHDLQSMDPAGHMVGLEVTASAEDDHYFDVVYKIISFSLPVKATPTPKGRK